MKFVTFVENRYQEVNYQMQLSKEYLLPADAEVKALTQLLNWYRVANKYLLMPRILWQFFMVKMGKGKAPEPILLNRAKADLAAKQAAEKMLGKENVSPLFGKSAIAEAEIMNDPTPTGA